MKMRLLLAALFALSPAFAADKPAPRDKSAAADTSGGVVCEKKKELGSNQVKRVCTTSAERSVAKDKAQAKLHKLGTCSGNEMPCTGDL